MIFYTFGEPGICKYAFETIKIKSNWNSETPVANNRFFCKLCSRRTKKVVFPNSCLLDYIVGQQNDNYKTECARFVAFHYGHTATEGHCR